MRSILGILIVVAMATASASGEGPGAGPPAAGEPAGVPGGAKAGAVMRPRQPGGILGDYLGTYLTIEGVLDDRKGKVETNSLMVDTVNGKKLEKPLSVLIRNARKIPARERCVLKGYELGEMIGTPPAVIAAAREQGRKEEGSQAVWRWRPYFVVLIVVEPEGLELLGEERGH